MRRRRIRFRTEGRCRAAHREIRDGAAGLGGYAGGGDVRCRKQSLWVLTRTVGSHCGHSRVLWEVTVGTHAIAEATARPIAADFPRPLHTVSGPQVVSRAVGNRVACSADHAAWDMMRACRP